MPAGSACISAWPLPMASAFMSATACTRAGAGARSAGPPCAGKRHGALRRPTAGGGQVRSKDAGPALRPATGRAQVARCAARARPGRAGPRGVRAAALSARGGARGGSGTAPASAPAAARCQGPHLRVTRLHELVRVDGVHLRAAQIDAGGRRRVQDGAAGVRAQVPADRHRPHQVHHLLHRRRRRARRGGLLQLLQVARLRAQHAASASPPGSLHALRRAAAPAGALPRPLQAARLRAQQSAPALLLLPLCVFAAASWLNGQGDKASPGRASALEPRGVQTPSMPTAGSPPDIMRRVRQQPCEEALHGPAYLESPSATVSTRDAHLCKATGSRH